MHDSQPHGLCVTATRHHVSTFVGFQVSKIPPRLSVPFTFGTALNFCFMAHVAQVWRPGIICAKFLPMLDQVNEGKPEWPSYTSAHDESLQVESLLELK